LRRQIVTKHHFSRLMISGKAIAGRVTVNTDDLVQVPTFKADWSFWFWSVLYHSSRPSMYASIYFFQEQYVIGTL